VCRSLDEAHALGIIHRDLKPTNIHLEPGPGGDEVVKVLDFGIAKILQSSELDSTDLTSAGQMIGTLDYMSPEQMVGSGITGQTDQYTLGIVMYEMVAGQRPFADADSAVAVLAQMLKTNPPPLIQRAPVPPAFDQIVMRCLERESKDRYPDVRALGTALDIVLGDIEAEVSEVTRAVSTVAEVTRALSSGSDALHTLPFDRDADPHEAATVLATGDALNEAATVMSSEVPDDEDHTVIGSARGRAQAQRLGTASEVLRAAPSVHVHPSIGVAPAATTQTTAPFLPSRAKPQLPPPSAAPAASTPPPVYGAPPPAFGAPASSGPPPGPAPQNYVQGYGPPPGAFGTPPPGAYGSPPGPFNAMPQPHYGAPPQPPYGGPMAPYGVRPYDMAASAAREATIRRIVWIVVLAAGTIVGIALATQL
jgi:serine/threonine-protein kinase